MKNTIVLVACLLTRLSIAQTWEPLHTFTSNAYSLLACGATQQICLGKTGALGNPFYVATSSNFTNWTEHGSAALPSHLFDTSLYLADIQPIAVTAVPDGFLLVVLKTEYPEMGNLRYRTLLSLRSSDGLAWNHDSTIQVGTRQVRNHFLRRVGETTVFMYGDYPDGWIEGEITSDCYVFTYLHESNIWTQTYQTNAHPYKYQLFSDDTYFYLLHGNYPQFTFDIELGGTVIDPGYMVRSSDSIEWLSFPGPKQYVSSADAHAGRIFGEGAHYSDGADWQIISNTPLSFIRYNGNTVVGMRDTNLVVSKDFGISWSSTPLTEPNHISIVECTNRYLALLTERFRDGDPHTPDEIKTSLFAVASNSPRTLHTDILILSMPEPKRLTFEAESNVLYQVEITRDLVEPEWLPYGLPWVGTGTQLSIPLGSWLQRQAFFRVVTPPE